jgi:predicted enzyme related to lactoylglutathione lyase
VSGTGSDISYIFAGMPVTQYDRAIAWYERLFGRVPDIVVREDGEAMWQLVGQGWVYVVDDAVRAGSALLTYLVSDLDVHLVNLASRGIEIPPVEIEAGLFKRVRLNDPDGNRISIGESLKGKS